MAEIARSVPAALISEIPPLMKRLVRKQGTVLNKCSTNLSMELAVDGKHPLRFEIKVYSQTGLGTYGAGIKTFRNKSMPIDAQPETDFHSLMTQYAERAVNIGNENMQMIRQAFKAPRCKLLTASWKNSGFDMWHWLNIYANTDLRLWEDGKLQPVTRDEFPENKEGDYIIDAYCSRIRLTYDKDLDSVIALPLINILAVTFVGETEKKQAPLTSRLLGYVEEEKKESVKTEMGPPAPKEYRPSKKQRSKENSS